MLTTGQLVRSLFVCITATCIASTASAQVCDGVAAQAYSESAKIERQVDDTRYVPRADFTGDAGGNYILEFDARRTDVPDFVERWIVTFQDDVAFDSIRHLDIDGAWMHSFKSRIVGGVRHVTLAVPGASVEISPSDGPGSPKFAAFLALAAQTAAHRAVVSSVAADFLPPGFPPLGCIHDCTTDVEMCGYLPICDPPDPPTACDCWDSYECCMDDYMNWHLCGINCICTFCYAGFVEECCALMEAVQSRMQLECETNLIACLSSRNLLPCPQN